MGGHKRIKIYTKHSHQPERRENKLSGLDWIRERELLSLKYYYTIIMNMSFILFRLFGSESK
jgi:hypothetical protein